MVWYSTSKNAKPFKTRSLKQKLFPLKTLKTEKSDFIRKKNNFRKSYGNTDTEARNPFPKKINHRKNIPRHSSKVSSSSRSRIGETFTKKNNYKIKPMEDIKKTKLRKKEYEIKVLELDSELKDQVFILEFLKKKFPQKFQILKGTILPFNIPYDLKKLQVSVYVADPSSEQIKLIGK